MSCSGQGTFLKFCATLAPGFLKWTENLCMCEQDALRTYLLRKLDFMGKEDRSQITMIATWSAELYLDKVYLEIHSAI